MGNSGTQPFWQFTADHWLQELKSSPAGLTSLQAKDRLHDTGILPLKTSGLKKDLQLFAGQFKSPLMLLLIGAVLLSSFLGDKSDVIIILSIVLSSGTLSFYQERNAGKVVEKLQALIAITCTVVRDGTELEVPADAIVPGDVLIFNAGDLIPADCLIMEATELHANESSLTGESFPVRKESIVLPEQTELSKRSNCLWQGTNIVSGNGKAIVIHTGSKTIFSNIAASTGMISETAFEKGIREFGYFLMKITLAMSVFILVVNLLNHKNVVDSALFALALAVGMAPELLPAITTIAMSAGAKRLLARKVIVKKLSSVQNLGEVSLLCTDKTGTITEGSIGIAGIVGSDGADDTFTKELAYWNAYFETGYGNPIDEALKRMPVQTNLSAVKTGEVPYDFIRKRLSITVRAGEQTILITKGAFKEVIGCCTQYRTHEENCQPVEEVLDKLKQQYETLGEKGLRAIAVAYKYVNTPAITKDDETGLIFSGFILMQDPVKEGIIETIHTLQSLHVELKIITGDNKNVARSIALKLGIDNPVVMTGADLLSTSPEALIQLARQVHIFAEVEPQQKERIIRALRKSYTVAYMGDGINDVSAITAADIGISVDNAVDVAREAADFVLMEKDLSVLAEGIKEGRKTFANTLKYIYISTGSTFGNMCSVAAASLMLPFLPMLPKQILLTNFITDFPYLAVASDHVDEEQVRKPGKWNMRLIRNYMITFGIHSSLFDIITFLTLLYILNAKESVFQTGWFIESSLSELLILFIIRTHKSFFKSKPAAVLLLLSILGVVITITLPYMPFAGKVGFTSMPVRNLLTMLGILLTYVLTADALKVWFFKQHYKKAMEHK